MNSNYIKKSMGKTEVQPEEKSIKIIYGAMFTNNSMKILTKEYKVDLGTLTAKELQILLMKAKEEEKIIVDEYQNAVWIEDDMEAICCIDEMDDFCKIEELKIYVTKYPSQDSDYNIHGKFGDTSEFLRDYLMIADYNDLESCNRIFEDNLNNIHWYDKNNELKDAVDNQLTKITNDIKGDDIIIFMGEIHDTLEAQIRAFVDYKEDHKIMGLHYGKTIFKIKNKLYYLTNGCFTYNNKRYWELKEVGKKSYKLCGMS